MKNREKEMKKKMKKCEKHEKTNEKYIFITNIS